MADFDSMWPTTGTPGLLKNPSNSLSMWDKFNNFMGGKSFGNFMDLGSLALNAYGMNKSLGIAQDQLGILKDQENRAATAQNLATNNSQSLALQMTTPGTAEHEAVKKAIETGQYAV